MRFNETDYSTPGQLDFVPRMRRGEVTRTVIGFVVTLVMIFALGLFADKLGSMHVTLASMAIVVVLCFFVVYRKQQDFDLVMATEYQNMLFSQAAALGASFCLFVKQDGTVVYANDGMRTLFPHFAYSNTQALEGIFDQAGVQKADRERIMGAIVAGKAERIVFPLRAATGEPRDYILTVEPLPRPGGFLIIRGREYRDQRAGVQLLPEMLRSTSADKIDHLLATAPVGHYVTDEFGRFEYVNPAFEGLLGYAPGDMLASRLDLKKMLYQLNGQPVGEDYALADYSGAAVLANARGQYSSVLLNQSLIRDARGKPAGVTGSVLPQRGNA